MENRILKNKAFLYLTEFFAGMSVMAVELGASRLLAPYFSSSQIVWTIIIGTIMIAMALGNIYGGKSADKDPNPDKLYRRIVVAAIWIALIPLVGKYLILGVSALMIVAVDTYLLIWASLVSCLVIFVFPLFLLGTVTPSLIKYTTTNLEESGRIAGRLGASNTIGSIIGTFLPTFVTIPAVGTAITFLIFAGILLIIGIIYFAGSGRGKKLMAIGLTALGISSVFGHESSFAFWEKDLAFEGESVYNYLQVKEESDRIILSTNVLFGVQSIAMKNDELTGFYYEYALAAPYMIESKEPVSVLILGNGTGTYAKLVRDFFPEAEIVGVEIDGKIIDLAEEYFQQPRDMDVVEYDGRAYLAAVDEKYDVILVDAYRDITIPFQMSSVEFFDLVKEHLREDGVMVVNLNLGSETEAFMADGEGTEASYNQGINDYLADTIDSVFDETYSFRVPYTTNAVIFAGEGNLSEALKKGLERAESRDLKKLLTRVRENMKLYSGGNHIMTDDKAPVEMLGMRQIDILIREELGYYKEKILSGDFDF